MKSKIIWGGIIILFVLCLINVYIILGNTPDSKIFMRAEITGDGVVGFNNSNDSLQFGSMAATSGGIRTINLVNDADYPQEIKLIPTGDIAKWIDLPENKFILNPDDEKKATINFIPTSDIPLGNHTGYLLIYSDKA